MMGNDNVPKDTCSPTHQDTDDSNVITIHPLTNSSEGELIGFEGCQTHYQVPEKSETDRWSHIPDLDDFFRRVYSYYQGHGFIVMVLEKIRRLLQIPFLFGLMFILFCCINYTALFRNDEKYYSRKVTLTEVFHSPSECLNSAQTLHKLYIIFIVTAWLLLSIHGAYDLIQYWDIKQFYNKELKIQDHELSNFTWYEIQERLLIVQSEVSICITKRHLTQLDIHHRILRFKNYMVAMINKDVFPVKFTVPLLGEIIHFSGNYLFNIEVLLFRSSWGPFENNWHVNADYKKPEKKEEVVNNLKKHILYLGIINLILSPFIFVWHVLYLVFTYAEQFKRKPSTLGIRYWSKYAHLYFRHFNELDHELNARLHAAYESSVQYMASFHSPLMAVIAKNISMIAGYCFTVILMLTIYDEDVLTVQHILTIITALGLVLAACRSFIPDENAVWYPGQRMKEVQAHLQYIPSTWQELAHTTDVRNEFNQLFQNKFVYLVHELISPVVTPLILLTSFHKRAPQIVEFFHNFTVNVIGVGDVCSFAQMNTPKHGGYDWRSSSASSSTTMQPNENATTEVSSTQNKEIQSEHGKTELSLLNFAWRNTAWPMPSCSQSFVDEVNKGISEKTREDAMTSSVYTETNAHLANPVPLLKSDPCNTSKETSFHGNTEDKGFGIFTINGSIRSNASLNNYVRDQPKFEERITRGFGVSLMGVRSLGASMFGEGAPFQSWGNVVDMHSNSLYSHDNHQNGKLQRENSGVSENQQSLSQRTHREDSNLPISHVSCSAPSTSGILVALKHHN